METPDLTDGQSEHTGEHNDGKSLMQQINHAVKAESTGLCYLLLCRWSWRLTRGPWSEFWHTSPGFICDWSPILCHYQFFGTFVVILMTEVAKSGNRKQVMQPLGAIALNRYLYRPLLPFANDKTICQLKSRFYLFCNFLSSATRSKWGWKSSC